MPIRAELSGSETCTTKGFGARGHAPAVQLCRTLIEAGFDPGTPLEAYRGDVLALRVRSIGEAAGMEINSKGTGFVARRAVRTAAPMPKSSDVGIGQGGNQRAAGEAVRIPRLP